MFIRILLPDRIPAIVFEQGVDLWKLGGQPLGKHLGVEQIAHANIVPFAIAAAVGIARKWPPKPTAERRSDLRPLPPVVDRWLVKVHSLETLPLQKGHLLYGSSVICVACKEPAIP